MGHGSRQMCRMNKYGFPRTGPKLARTAYGFRTGDLVKAVVPSGTYRGTHEGSDCDTLAPSFRLNGIDLHPRLLKRVQRADGYAYSCQPDTSPAA